MKDKVIWITGASSGIGKACAEMFSQKGSKVILSARRKEKLLEVKQGLNGPSTILPMDVSDTDQINNITSEAAKIYGPIDVLINNAGISQRGFVEDTDMTVDRRLFEVNYFGNIAVTKAVLPSMLDRKSGQIAIISSVAGKLSTPGRSSYAATKHALQGYYDALRAEIASRNVHVNLICPGYIKTDISLHALDGKGEKHGVMDQGQADGMPVEECAKQIYNAIVKNRRETLIGGRETKMVLARKIFPGMYYRAIEKMARERTY